MNTCEGTRVSTILFLGATIALGTSILRRASKIHIRYIYSKGGMRHIFCALLGLRPRKCFRDSRGPETWNALDEMECIATTKDPVVVLCGSSILRRWDRAREHLAPLPILNRAFGGSRTWELDIVVADRVATYQPRVLIHYCGSNDFAWAAVASADFKATALQAANNTRHFIQRLSEHVPNVRIILVSCIKSPKKRQQGSAPAIDQLNRLLRDMCEGDSARHFVDLNSHLEEPLTGDAQSDLYLDDGVHFKEETYYLIGQVLAPIVRQLYNNCGNCHESSLK